MVFRGYLEDETMNVVLGGEGWTVKEGSKFVERSKNISGWTFICMIDQVGEAYSRLHVGVVRKMNVQWSENLKSKSDSDRR